MPFAARLGGVLLLACGVVACESDVIAQKESQSVQVAVSATGVAVRLYHTWGMIEDNNNDNVADDGQSYLFCETIPGNQGAPVTLGVISAPWKFGIEVAILRAGTTEFETISGVAFLDSLANVAQYDTTLPPTITAPNRSPVTTNNRTFKFPTSSYRQLTAVHREVVMATSNPLSTLEPQLYPYRAGLCSLGDPGPATVSGATQPFVFELLKGDTLRVSARKALEAPAELQAPDGSNVINSQPQLSATISLDAVSINDTISGTRQSTTDAGDGFSFFYTAR